MTKTSNKPNIKTASLVHFQTCYYGISSYTLYVYTLCHILGTTQATPQDKMATIKRQRAIKPVQVHVFKPVRSHPHIREYITSVIR